MKFLVAAFLAIALVSVQATESGNKIKHFSEGCMETTGVDHDIVVNARKGEFVDDEKYMKYCHCMCKKMNIMDDEGHLHEEHMLDNLPEGLGREEGTKIMKKCIGEAHDET
ncbi:pheromone/general odorant binding protein, partial [Sphingomonas sp. Leaf339]|uniref:pheromone/general odorant binding protein n=1 Tax=Sphingomonas sp. Leaf339 TaxID=1736343 RepID=UPI0012E38875